MKALVLRNRVEGLSSEEWATIQIVSTNTRQQCFKFSNCCSAHLLPSPSLIIDDFLMEITQSLGEKRQPGSFWLVLRWTFILKWHLSNSRSYPFVILVLSFSVDESCYPITEAEKKITEVKNTVTGKRRRTWEQRIRQWQQEYILNYSAKSTVLNQNSKMSEGQIFTWTYNVVKRTESLNFWVGHVDALMNS